MNPEEKAKAMATLHTKAREGMLPLRTVLVQHQFIDLPHSKKYRQDLTPQPPPQVFTLFVANNSPMQVT